MARSRFEMFQYRQALVRMRQSNSDREIAAGKVMGRRKAAALRRVAPAHGWLEVDRALPDNDPIGEFASTQRGLGYVNNDRDVRA